jgi:hypothetical protein
MNHFSAFVSERLGHYVYRLIDPRNGDTFYVGRGQGDRIFAHVAESALPNSGEEQPDLKLNKIRLIKLAGFSVQHVVHRHGLNESQAREVEAALIDAYPGVSNKIGGYHPERGVMHADEIIRTFEADEAVFRHKVLLVSVHNTSEDRDLYEATRFAWRVTVQRAAACEYVLAVRRRIIVGVFTADEWLQANKDNFPEFDVIEDGRYGFKGRTASAEVANQYLQKRVPEKYRFYGGAVRYVEPDD